MKLIHSLHAGLVCNQVIFFIFLFSPLVIYLPSYLFICVLIDLRACLFLCLEYGVDESVACLKKNMYIYLYCILRPSLLFWPWK